MRNIKYGFFGEDDAQRLFLKHYLAVLSKGQNWQVEADEAFALRYQARNKAQVDDLFDEACQIGLSQYQQQCFFVGRDLDAFSEEALHELQIAMQLRLQRRGVRAILLVPVQCIEHWLWYLQWHSENPSSTKNMSFETQPRGVAKTALYGSPKVSTKYSNSIVERIAGELNIDWLASRSRSFLAFHKQVEGMLASLLPAA